MAKSKFSGFSRRVIKRDSQDRSARASACDPLYQCRLLALTLPTTTLFFRTAAAAGGRVQELVAQVKHVSSSAHDLSRRLHPSTLEQLGLVATVGSLCRELSQSHDLKIEFTHDRMPDGISPDTAVCLYRIVQEGLRNAVKHGTPAAPRPATLDKRRPRAHRGGHPHGLPSSGR